MTLWAQRSREEQALLNPAFCATLLWHGARGYSNLSSGAMSFEEAFLILPFVLHRKTREILPRSTRTSMAVWLDQYPLSRGTIASRARHLVPFTKEGMLFGGLHGLLKIENNQIYALKNWRWTIIRTFGQTSDEVRTCSKKADFIGRWFALTGNALTVLALMGIRP